jgi:hypothetical protein
MLTPRVIVVTIIVLLLGIAVVTSTLDTMSKVAALFALVLAEFLALRRRDGPRV